MSKVTHLEWPEFEHSNEREVFYKSLLSLLEPAKWIAVVPNPAPLGAIRKNIEADCDGLLIPIDMPHDGVAWLVQWDSAISVLPGIFHARRPELIFLSFLEKPDLPNIVQALQHDKPSPALRRLHFDDGEMLSICQWEVFVAEKATIYKANLTLVDMDRSVYDDFNLTIALHPSETVERMMVRILAFCYRAAENLIFAKGLSSTEEPDLWLKHDNGTILEWIEVGQPAPDRLKRRKKGDRFIF